MFKHGQGVTKHKLLYRPHEGLIRRLRRFRSWVTHEQQVGNTYTIQAVIRWLSHRIEKIRACQNQLGIEKAQPDLECIIAEKLHVIVINRLVTKRNSTITKTVLKHQWKTVEYMYARGKGCARGAGDLEHDGGCLG